jgi:hypothetical protein
MTLFGLPLATLLVFVLIPLLTAVVLVLWGVLFKPSD